MVREDITGLQLAMKPLSYHIPFSDRFLVNEKLKTILDFV